MVDKRGPKAGGFKSNTGGERKPYAKREGGFDRKPREGGDRPARSYTPRDGGDRPARPYVKREGGYAASGDRPARPYTPRDGGDRKPYVKREGGYSAGGDRPARPYTPRDGGDRKPYVKREGSYERRPYEGSSPRAEGDRPARPYTPRDGGDRKPYVKREGNYEKRPYTPREGGSSGGYEKRAYTPRDGGERKPYVKRESGFDRAPREGGYEKRPYTPREPREGGDRPYTPREPREGGYEKREWKPRESFDRGDSKSAKFAEKRTIKRDRRPAEDKDTGLMRGDGWLIGYHAVLAALSTGRRKVRTVWLLSEAQGELGELVAKNPDWIVEIHSKPDFEKQFGEMVHQGVAALVGNLPQPSLPELLSEKPKLIVALDQITDPHNLGAIVRSCAAFGAQAVLVTEHRAAGLNATAAKVAAGAMEVVPVVEITNLAQSIEMLKEAGFTVLGMTGDAETEIGDVKVTGPICLVLGSEGEGLRRLTRESCDQLVKIKIAPTMESLNVSVATGVALNLLTRK